MNDLELEITTTDTTATISVVGDFGGEGRLRYILEDPVPRKKKWMVVPFKGVVHLSGLHTGFVYKCNLLVPDGDSESISDTYYFWTTRDCAIPPLHNCTCGGE